MAVDLDIRWATQAGSATGSLGLRYYNSSGTPVQSCTRRDLGEGTYSAQYNGQFVADVYVLDFTTGPNVTVTADLGSKNPYHNLTPVSITADGATVHADIIGGVDLVFSSGTANGNQAIVTVGAYLSAGGVDTNALNFGILPNNDERVEIRAAVVNTGTDTAADVTVTPVPASYYTGTDAESIIARLGPHSTDSRAQLATATAHSMTFDTWTNQGSYYSANVNIGGSLCIATAKFDGETIYEYGSGNGYVDSSDYLKGLQVVFAKTSTSPVGKTLTVTVRDGWSWVEVAPDVAGSAGAWQSGPISLGDIAASGTTYCWFGMTIPEGQARGAIRLWTPRVRFSEI
jgi:hypothetical protein